MSRERLAWGERLFSSGTYRRVAFTPWLYLFLWGAAIRLGFSDQYPPVPFVGPSWSDHVWTTLAVVCPMLALAAWWLIDHSRWNKATLAGIWVRFIADIGMMTVILTYHMSVVLNNKPLTESRIFSRYIVGSCLMFMILVLARDVWVIRRTERVARKIRDG